MLCAIGTPLIGLLASADVTYTIGQFFLASSFWFSLWILSDYPIVNPQQALIVIFYWWIGIGPSVIAAYNLILGNIDEVNFVISTGVGAIWILIFGLPLYAFAARSMIQYFDKRKWYVRFIQPQGKNFRPKTIYGIFSTGLLISCLLFALEMIGERGIESINYLGGTITENWWIGGIAAIGGGFMSWAKVIAISELIHTGKDCSKGIKIVALAIIGYGMVVAVTSGWKSAFLALLFYALVAYVSKMQTIPYKSLFLIASFYLFLIEPFVFQGRLIAESRQITSAEERKAVFIELLLDRENFIKDSWKSINIKSPFRGISYLAGEVVNRNSILSGEWRGLTLKWGFETVIPRALYPNKPDLNIGNFFCQRVAADLGMASSTDFITNVGIGVPYELVGNFGWIVGVAGFSLVGFFWSALCSWLLTPGRLSDHPLTPLFVMWTFAFEQSIGNYLAGFRDFLIFLLALYVFTRIFRIRLL